MSFMRIAALKTSKRCLTRAGGARAAGFESLPTASGGIARAAYAAAAKARLALPVLLDNAGLSELQLKRPHVRIPVRNQIKFLNEVSSALQDDFLGIHLAQSVDLRELGVLYYVMASSENLGTALMRLAHYSAIQNDGVRIACRQTKQLTVRFVYVGVARASDCHQMEFFATILLRLCRHLTRQQVAPSRIRFVHRRTSVPAKIRALFVRDIEFGAGVDEVILPLSASDMTTVNADPYLNSLLLQYCDQIIASRHAKPGDWRSTVENVIAPLLPHGEATIDNVAQRLGMSRRTLARRLAAEDMTFVAVLNEFRLALAQRYLREQGLAIAEVAWLLGFDEISAFSHACKRWTGMSPTQLRQMKQPMSLVAGQLPLRGATI